MLQNTDNEIRNIPFCDMTQKDRKWRVVTESEATRRDMSAAFVILVRKNTQKRRRSEKFLN